jgi:hypothetical protein
MTVGIILGHWGVIDGPDGDAHRLAFALQGTSAGVTACRSSAVVRISPVRDGVGEGECAIEVISRVEGAALRCAAQRALVGRVLVFALRCATFLPSLAKDNDNKSSDSATSWCGGCAFRLLTLGYHQLLGTVVGQQGAQPWLRVCVVSER